MDLKTLYIIVISGFVLFALLFMTKSSGSKKANIHMSLFLLGMAVAILQNLFKELQLGIYFFGIPASYTIGVSLYFYTQYAIGKEKKDFANNYFIHYFPAFLFLIILVVYESGISNTDLNNSRHEYLMDNSLYTYLFVGMMIHFFAYAFLSLIKIREYETLSENYTSQEIEKGIVWLKQLLLTLIIIGLCTVLAYVIKLPRSFIAILPVLCFVVIIMIVVKAITQPVVFSELRFDNLKKSLEDIATKENNENLSEIIQAIDSHLRSQKTYIKSDYSVKDLSDELKLPSYKVSKSINELLNTNFSSYINQWRIQEAKHILQDKNNQHLTIDAIGEMVGFNSRVSFISSFKKVENTTPHAFRVNV